MKPEQGFILVVDDNEANRDVLSRRLKRQGHNTALAEHGKQALQMARTQSFDLILLDIMMPEMNGYQVLEELKKDPTLRHIPIIMISALDDIDSVVRCVELGAEDYLSKPFNPVLLRARVSASLEKKWLRDQEQAHLKAIKRELELGRRIQADFLPSTLPNLPGWEISTAFHPAREVAGDFYDVFALTDDHIGFIVADVCDKGVGAALFMALIRSLLRAFSEQLATNALQSVSMTNNYIAHHHNNRRSRHMFATLFFGILHLPSGNTRYVNAGHEEPIIMRQSGELTSLEVTGPAVGFVPEAVFDIATTTLHPGDTFFLYTDGITEARNGQGEFFGEERVMALLRQPYESVTTLQTTIEAHIQEYIGEHNTPSDDITMLILRHLLHT